MIFKTTTVPFYLAKTAIVYE